MAMYESLRQMEEEEDEETKQAAKKLGMFDGVFVPCTLSIFGVILFQRLGWIVGQAGIGQFTIMLFVGYLVVTTTVLSLSALSTNGLLKGGGAYYLVSRALGPELGGAIGVIFYAANVSGCAVYLLGFAEEMVDVLGGERNQTIHVIVALIALLGVTIICFIGPQLYAKTSMAIFVGMVICLVLTFISFFARSGDSFDGYTGLSSSTFNDNESAHYSGENDFAVVFSILFPAVTGIMAGANMSGQLRKPARSIPLGTLLATGLSAIVYLGFALIIAGTTLPSILASTEGYSILRRVSIAPWSVSAGIFMAVLSSCMGSEIGAGEILTALARDDLLPILSVFNPSGPNGKVRGARRAVVATFVLIALTLCSGTDLNEMATFQTLFFLLSYAIINLACFILSIQGSPNFRPIWPHYSWHMAGFGFLSCVGVMFYTHPLRASLALFLCMLLIGYLGYRAPAHSWGDVTQSLIFHQVRKYLLRLDERKMHIKFWRPQILLFCANPRDQYRLIHFANNLKKGGLLMLGTVLHNASNVGPSGALSNVNAELVNKLEETRKGWLEYISGSRLKAFPIVTASGSMHAGAQSLLMMAGLGALKPNTTMIAFYDEKVVPSASVNSLHLSQTREDELMNSMHRFPPLASHPPHPLGDCGLEEYLQVVADGVKFGQNLLIARHFQYLPHYLVDGSPPPESTRTYYIDVWWLPDEVWGGGGGGGVDLCLLLAWMLRRSRGSESGWSRHSKLRVCTIVESEDQKERTKTSLEKILVNTRVTADDIKIVVASQVNEKDPRYSVRYSDCVRKRATELAQGGGGMPRKGSSMASLGDEKASPRVLVSLQNIATEGGVQVTETAEVKTVKRNDAWYNKVMRSESRHTAVAFLPMGAGFFGSHAAGNRPGSPVADAKQQGGGEASEQGGKGMRVSKENWSRLQALTEEMCPVVLCHSQYSPVVKEM